MDFLPVPPCVFLICKVSQKQSIWVIISVSYRNTFYSGANPRPLCPLIHSFPSLYFFFPCTTEMLSPKSSIFPRPLFAGIQLVKSGRRKDPLASALFMPSHLLPVPRLADICLRRAVAQRLLISLSRWHLLCLFFVSLFLLLVSSSSFFLSLLSFLFLFFLLLFCL